MNILNSVRTGMCAWRKTSTHAENDFLTRGFLVRQIPIGNEIIYLVHLKNYSENLAHLN